MYLFWNFVIDVYQHMKEFLMLSQ